MLIFPNAKINLGLFVTEKRPDGYHNIESAFVPISLQDSLEIVKSDGDSFEMEIFGIHVEGDIQNNLCAKAWRFLHNQFGIDGIKCALLKNIPTGAGLGGGSADGAFMLKALNEIFNLNLSNNQLEKFAGQLGSDCPFFIDNTHKYVFGRGEYLENINLNLKGYSLVIVHPTIHISTAQAYSLIKPEPSKFNLKELSDISIFEWKNILYNQFEEPISELHPEIRIIKNKLYESGAIYASMSGSGSAIYGIFDESQNLSSLFENYYVRTVEFL